MADWLDGRGNDISAALRGAISFFAGAGGAGLIAFLLAPFEAGTSVYCVPADTPCENAFGSTLGGLVTSGIHPSFPVVLGLGIAGLAYGLLGLIGHDA